jgi:hypothetical protein
MGSYMLHVRIKWERYVTESDFAFADDSCMTNARGWRDDDLQVRTVLLARRCIYHAIRGLTL